ncbi:MAG: GNAT family N-acetyltransferase [Thermoanaerobaculia bacterium]
MEVRELSSEAEIAAACPLMRELRDRVREEPFLGEFRSQQADGYRLYGSYDSGRLVALAGVRRSHTLSRGEHLFVDDLVTAEGSRGRGHGAAMLRWLGRQAAADGVPRVYLDSRATARGFYERLGFTFLTSIPCWIETSVLR